MVAAPIDQKNIQFKKIWQTVSGSCHLTSREIVLKDLTEIKTELLNGIKRSADTASSDKLADCPEKLQPFIEKLKQYLDLDQQKTWETFSCYLKNEYNDSIDLLMNFLKTETNTEKLLDHIWHFYSLERMTLLKIVKNLLESCDADTNSYRREYQQVLNEIGLANLRKSYIEQLTQLIREPVQTKFSHTELFNVHGKLVSCAERRLREINEILQILLLIVNRDYILVPEFKTLVDLFKQHSFGRQQPHLDLNGNILHKDLVVKITYSEVVLFMACIEERPIKDASSENISNIDKLQEISNLLDKDIVLLHQNPEHGPILLSWMLMNFQLIELEANNPEFRKFQQYGTKAAQLGVFSYLQKVITHPMFRDQSPAATIAYQTVYKVLATLCDIFDSDRAVVQHKNIFELLCELLKHPVIAAKFLSSTEDGAQALFQTAIDNFPVDFVPLSMIACSLTATSNDSEIDVSSAVRERIEKLPTYVEYYDSQRVSLRLSDFNENECILVHDYWPFGEKVNYMIPAGTTAVILDKPTGPLIRFNTKLNYFDALHHEINELLLDLLKYPEISVQRKQCVYWGLKYLAAEISRVNHPHEISGEMVHPTEMVFDIFLKFKDVPNPPVDLLAQCFNVCTALVPTHRNDIYKRIINLDILPFCTTDKLSFDEYANGAGFDTRLAGYYLVSFEKVNGKYEFLSAYLAFLKMFQSLSDCTVSLELPGLIFLLREVFPYIHTWRFENESDRQQIMTQILLHFDWILKIGDGNARLILRNTCVYSLLNLDSGLTLLRMVALGNAYIEEAMQNETNWMIAKKTSFNYLVQLSMSILMIILRLRFRFDEKPATTSPLENVIYAQPKHIIPVVTGYMRNIFNRQLPVLVCRLLRRFALEFQMSLFACLDMEPSQIRSTFIERIENEQTCNDLKMAIFEFVEACIEKQPGMTEAFFTIDFDERKKPAKEDDQRSGVLRYMKKYLELIGDDDFSFGDVLEDDLHMMTKVMSLFHSLWKSNMQQLVEKLQKETQFWPRILNPLFGEIRPRIRIYSQLFNMIGLELYRLTEAKNIDAKLKSTLDRFLDKNVFLNWVDDVLDVPEEMDIATDDTPDWLNRLQSFKDLFIIILRRRDRHGVEVPPDSLKYFADQCLKRLIERLNYTDDMRPFIILAELYLSLLYSHAPKQNISIFNADAALPQINLLVNQLSITYSEMHIRAKEAILAITFRAIDLFGAQLKENSDVTMDFIDSVIKILCFELMEAETELKAKVKASSEPLQGERKSLSFVLSLNIFKTIVKDCNGDVYHRCIEYKLQEERMFNRILSCLHVTLPLRYARKLSSELLDMLIVFANGQFSSQLLYCDLSYYLWMKLLPPKDLLQPSYTVTVTPANPAGTTVAWQSHEWWPIYSRGIRLVHSLLQRQGHIFAKEAIAFVGVHETFLMDSMLLAKHALHETPMRLIKNAVELVCELVPYEKQWRLEHQQSMINLMRCVQILLDHAVSLLYRPKHLSRLIKVTNIASQANKDAQNTTDDETFEDEVKAMNELIEIVTICSKCLMAFSPTLLDLLTNSEFIPTKWQPLVEIQFNAPKLNVGATIQQLTFGTILNAAIIFTKALTLQQFRFDEHRLNEIKDPSDPNQTISDPAEKSRPNRRRNYTTSISALSSVSATAGATNEYLSNLDIELCFSALEFVLTLLASQSLLALKDVSLSQREKQLIKRELSTELSVFYDFVKKRVLPEIARDEPLRRKNHGCRSMGLSRDQQEELSKQISSGQRRPNSDRMRIDLTRKLYLKNQQSPCIQMPATHPFDMTHPYSPIAGGPSGRRPISSTPAQPSTSKAALDQMQQDEDDGIDECEGGADIFFDAEDPIYCETSFVQLVEEDYLHFLSNLFSYICHTEKIN